MKHVAPLAPQQRPVVAPGVSQWPEQHSLSAVQWTVGNTVLVMQHFPAVQVWPEQQYAVVSHRPPARTHSHCPFVQKPLQHWAALVQDVWPPQQTLPRQVPP